jgi:hypothetical protein
MARGRPGGRGAAARFPAFVLGLAAASLAWLIGVMVTVTSPDDAARQRASPTLPPAIATLSSQVLQQVAWNECTRSEERVDVTAPAVPSGFRQVVTSVARSGTEASTGTVLARIAGEPLIAVITDAVLYRDLRLGDHGPDVVGLERSLAAAGLIATSDTTIDAATLAAWARLDPADAAGRIRVASVVAVPSRASVAGVQVRVGDSARPGSKLLEMVSDGQDFECQIAGSDAELTTKNVKFEVGGKSTPIGSLTTRNGNDDAGAMAIVRPSRSVSGSRGRLGVGFTDARPVLAAPLSAVKVAADGSASVVVVSGESVRQVSVTLGATAQGLVEVRGEGLKAGDQVQLFGAGQEGSEGAPPEAPTNESTP